MKMKAFDCFAVGLNVGLVGLLAWTFFVAFFNGNEVLININTYNERWPEAVALPIVLAMGMVTLVRMLRRIIKQ